MPRCMISFDDPGFLAANPVEECSEPVLVAVSVSVPVSIATICFSMKCPFLLSAPPAESCT